MIVNFILAYFIGVFSVLLFQAFLLYKWWSSKERESPKLFSQRLKVVNPKLIADYLRDDCATENETCMFLNLILAFVWREWRNTKSMKTFFMKRINSEFQDLLQSRTAGKVIEQITIQDFFLGTSLPVIKGVTIMKVGSKDPEEVPAELDLALDLEYTGGCHMAIQVDLLFGKSVYLAVKLVYLKGRARLQFSRHPCTHWSFSFYEFDQNLNYLYPVEGQLGMATAMH